MSFWFRQFWNNQALNGNLKGIIGQWDQKFRMRDKSGRCFVIMSEKQAMMKGDGPSGSEKGNKSRLGSEFKLEINKFF